MKETPVQKPFDVRTMTFDQACKFANDRCLFPVRIMCDRATGYHHVIAENAVPFWLEYGYESAATVELKIVTTRTEVAI